MRYEATDTLARQLTTGVSRHQAYGFVYPNLQLDRDVGPKVKLTFSAARRVTRPDAEALNPFIDYQDIHNLRAGNADLLPQDTWSLEAGLRRLSRTGSLGLTLYARFNRNAVTDVTQLIAADVALTTRANLPRSQALGIEAQFNGKLWSKLNYTVSGNAFYNQIDASALGFPGLRSTQVVNMKASLDYHPTSSDTAQISLSRSGKRLTPQGETGAIFLINLGYRHQLVRNLAFIVTASDVLNGQHYTRMLNTPTFTDTHSRRQFGQVVTAGLTYSLGPSKKARAAGFDYDQ